jgi:eukaryotic-like serine/threonine-protein kinase
MPTSAFDPLALRPADEVAGWRVLHHWRQDAFSVTWGVERAGERRLLRLTLRPPDSPKGPAMERYLEREAGALRRVQHPHIIRLHEDGRWPHPEHGFRYLLLEYVEGVSLESARKQGMTALDVANIFSRLASAIDAMHRVGVHHGAIGPRSLLLRGKDEPIIIDFTSSDWPGNPHPLPYRALAGFEGIEGVFPPIRTGPAFRMSAIPGKKYRS